MANSEKVVLIGDPVAHSLSPVFQQAAFDYLDINVRYETWQTHAEELKQKIDLLRSSDYRGANITIPHKLDAMNFVDHVDDIGEQVGAINTIISHDGVLTGTNTDVVGIHNSFKVANIDLKNKNVAITAGASAPDHMVQNIVDYIKPKNIEFYIDTDETEYFPLPVELRTNIKNLTNFISSMFPENKCKSKNGIKNDKHWSATKALTSL